jgi:putative Mn2+ efflux pump MntP
MLLLTYILFSLIIGMLPFSVAINSSVYRCIEWKETFRIAFVLALFQVGMALAGWGVGLAVRGFFSTMQVPVAIFIMLFVALRYFMETFRPGRDVRILISENRRMLIAFAVVTSINTVFLGIALGLIYQNILVFATVLPLVVFLAVIAGVRLGKLGLLNLGKNAERLAAVLLAASAVFILLQYLKII